jgi:hypothetical protein
MQMPLETPEVGSYEPRPKPDIDHQSSESLESCEDSGETSQPVLDFPWRPSGHIGDDLSPRSLRSKAPKKKRNLDKKKSPLSDKSNQPRPFEERKDEG